MSAIRLFVCCLVFCVYLIPAMARGQEGHSFDGLIEPSEVVKLSSPVQGTLAEITVERGDRVKKGQIIARLNYNVEKAAVDLAQARVEFARRKVARNEDLYKKELISIHEKDEMETELRVSELQLHEARERLELRTIRCTVDGVVVERLLSPGEYVGEDPILRIARINPLYVEVVVPAEKFGRIRKGMVATVKPELPISGKWIAHVIIVDTVIDAASGTFGVRLEMPNPDYRLPAGLKCKVIFAR
ncbi:MAG: efflux RND transporter periplasmic adaptor subunit [Thermodesulfobacteriota bacterium]